VILLGLAGCAFRPDVRADESVDVTPAPCTVTATEVSCEHATVVFHAGFAAREVHVQHPLGEPPAAGWPTAILYQGSFDTGGVWTGEDGAPFGGLHEARVTAALLDAGFAVLAPETRLDGFSYWDTNILPWSFAWTLSADHRLVKGILRAIDEGRLGPLDPDRLFAAGISSGGYMTSRMAVAYPGRFRALAIASGSYATCAGPACIVPALRDGHPPTLFLHGEADAVVPIGTMEAYADALDAAGVEVERVTDPDAGHGWIAAAPEAVVGWFTGR